MAITIDQINGLDIAFFGEPFVIIKNGAATNTGSLDIAYFGEPMFFQFEITPSGTTYDATKMFMMF